MTTKALAVVVALVVAVLAVGAAIDFAQRSLTVLLVGAVAFAAGWLLGIARRRDTRRPHGDGRDPEPWEER